jgi:CheY-like chemotaxis protein
MAAQGGEGHCIAIRADVNDSKPFCPDDAPAGSRTWAVEAAREAPGGYNLRGLPRQFSESYAATMAEKYRVLIADDNPPNRELLEAYLSEVDCDVEHAVDGQDTLDKVKSFQPHLILLDVMMPKLSGFEVCQKLKATATTKKAMILMVTALNEAGDIERAVQAGTDDFLSKPVNKLELLKRVQTMFRVKDLEDENERLRRYIEGMESDGPV